jgi:hypothetical protein
MVSTTGFGFLSDFAVFYRWAGEIWRGNYLGLYPYPLMILLAPISLLPLDVAAVLWLIAMIAALVLALRRESLYWVFFVPFLQGLFLGQLDPLFWLVYRSKRPWLWALLSLKPQLLLAVLPRIFASRRSLSEFLAGVAVLHTPFLLIRPAWPAEWIAFVSTYQENRLIGPGVTSSGAILFSAWVLPFAAVLLALFLMRRANWEGILFLANPFLLPYDYSLLMGRISKLIIPLSWVALWVAWQVHANWPYALLLLGVLAAVTIRERRPQPGDAKPGTMSRGAA